MYLLDLGASLFFLLCHGVREIFRKQTISIFSCQEETLLNNWTDEIAKILKEEIK
ncbi:hypothetical protein UKS_10010 [Streptococcus sp. 116-D4]|nr:hypothetical protein UKS_10010 [Streptococcus sp. 116-D4]